MLKHVNIFLYLSPIFFFCFSFLTSVAQSEDFQLEILSDNTVKITEYIGNSARPKIPSTINGRPVTIIGVGSFKNHTEILELNLPESIIVIQENAFNKCTGLKKVRLPSSIEQIEGNPFAECYELTRIFISPDNPFFAGQNNVLFNKIEKKLITYPAGISEKYYKILEGIISVGSKAFAGNPYLVGITIPDSVTSISSFAFAYCTSISKIHISNFVSEIDINPFVGCSNLNYIQVKPDNVYYAEIDGVLFNKQERSLISYPAGKNTNRYSIPDKIKEIKEMAFMSSENLVEIIIPDTVTKIGMDAFKDCKILTRLLKTDGTVWKDLY